MDAELAALASSGATTLVGLMISDGWAQTKVRIVNLFARGSSEQAGEITAELDAAQSQLVAATGRPDETVTAGLEAEWRSRFKKLLANDPQSVSELREILNELDPEADRGQASVHGIKMVAKATGHGRVYQVGAGDMHIGDA